MENITKLLPNHTIEFWQIGETDLLYPLHEKGEEMRGGAPYCAPMFSIQQRPVVGAHLPLHGLLMYRHKGDVNYDADSNTWTAHTHFKPSNKFNWNFSATTTLKVSDTKLKHSFSIERSTDCENQHEMPLSLGFHPYFSTFGKDFLLKISTQEYDKVRIPNDIINSYFAPAKDGEEVTLTTKAGIITMTVKGYDQFCLWTDDLDKYLCVEPIYQYKEFGLPDTGLKPGEKKVVTCELEFTPVND